MLSVDGIGESVMVVVGEPEMMMMVVDCVDQLYHQHHYHHQWKLDHPSQMHSNKKKGMGEEPRNQQRRLIRIMPGLMDYISVAENGRGGGVVVDVIIVG